MKIRNLYSKKFLAGLALFLCAALAAPRTAPAVTLTDQTRLTYFDSTSSKNRDRLGWRVAVTDDRMIAGAPGYLNVNLGTVPGFAVIFERSSGGTWSQAAKLAPSNGLAGDQFGNRVAISGDRAIVGAWRAYRQDGGNDRGSAYIFERASDGTWSQVVEFTGEERYNEFGRSVAISGDRAIVGARAKDQYRGAAYIYKRSSGGTWSLEAKLTAGDRQINDRFGESVAISGNTAVVGAHRDDDGRYAS